MLLRFFLVQHGRGKDYESATQALAVVVEAFVTMCAGTLPELFRGVGERLFRQEPLVRPPARKVLAISWKLFKLFLRSSILLLWWFAVSQVLLHLGNLLSDVFMEVGVRSQLGNSKPTVWGSISNNQVLRVILQFC